MIDYIRVGKRMSYLLRHNPENLTMDENGYVEVSDLLNKLRISKNDLDYIVENNDKKRYSYDESGSKIRASQGHSIQVDVELKPTKPPDILYHGTSRDNYLKIVRSGGLQKMNRLHVHLTEDIDVARSVGKRYSKNDKPILLDIDSMTMYEDGFEFFLSDNGVWLTDNVPLVYIIQI